MLNYTTNQWHVVLISLEALTTSQLEEHLRITMQMFISLTARSSLWDTHVCLSLTSNSDHMAKKCVNWESCSIQNCTLILLLYSTILSINEKSESSLVSAAIPIVYLRLGKTTNVIAKVAVEYPQSLGFLLASQ